MVFGVVYGIKLLKKKTNLKVDGAFIAIINSNQTIQPVSIMVESLRIPFP